MNPASTRQKAASLPLHTRAEPNGFDVFIDLSGAGSANVDVDCITRTFGTRDFDGACSIAWPRNVPPPQGYHLRSQPSAGAEPISVLDTARNRAVAMRRHLLVLTSGIGVDASLITQLIEALAYDPLIGTAQPRFATSAEAVWPLPPDVVRRARAIPIARDTLDLLPTYTLAPELLAACMLIRWDLLQALSGVQLEGADLLGGLFYLLCRARRLGMRGIIHNQAVVRSELSYNAAYPTSARADVDRLRMTYPEVELVDAELEALIPRRFEPVLDAVVGAAKQRRILVDCRDIPARHNGSTQCALGFLKGFDALQSVSQFEVLVSEESARYHRLPERYPGLRFLFARPQHSYAAAMTLTQPWSLSAVRDLHRSALVVVCCMIDTIAWDVLYAPGAGELGKVWRFIARHADGIFFNSYFTQERFRRRFPIQSGVLEQVTHHSFDKDEYTVDGAVSDKADYILLFGNELDHKHLRSTLQLLRDGFPLNPIVVFGLADASGHNITAISSGELDELEVHRLIARARVVVYPSIYEGFGLPVVESLAYGRPVVVRRSALWKEIAGWSRLPGELIEFDDASSLISCVGRVLDGRSAASLPSGQFLVDGASVATWRDCAQRALDLVQQCLDARDRMRWWEREEAFQAAGL